MIRLTPPTRSKIISSGWGADRSYRGGWHAGLDFHDPKGAPMLAAAPGVVAHVKNVSNSFAGKYTVIDHGSGVFTRYLHADQNFKQAGDRVERGEQIGTVGTTGTTSGSPHVHFDVKMQPAALAKYQEQFGAPTTGFSAEMKPWGRGVPAEALMDEAAYKPGVLNASLKRGVKLFQAFPITLIGLIGVAGAGYLLYRYLTR